MDAIRCADAAEWASWLEANHATSDEVWIQIAKKGSGIASVTAAGTAWKVRAKATGPIKKGTLVRVRVLNSCDGQGWKQVATARLSAKGTVAVSIAAPPAGGFQLVRLETAVPLRKGGKTSKTFTVPRGLR